MQSRVALYENLYKIEERKMKIIQYIKELKENFIKISSQQEKSNNGIQGRKYWQRINRTRYIGTKKKSHE